MQARYLLTPQQVAVLRALGEGIVELSSAEIAVHARLLPMQVLAALGGLERLGLVQSWVPSTGRPGEQLFVMTGEGEVIQRALAQFRGTPPAGAIVQIPSSLPSFSSWLSGRQSVAKVEITSEDAER